MLTGMVNLTQQSKASDNTSNKIFHANGHTADINSKNNLATSTKVTKVIGNNQISGSRSGDLTCPNGRHVGNAEISFGGFMSYIPLYGNWEVVAVNGEPGSFISQWGL